MAHKANKLLVKAEEVNGKIEELSAKESLTENEQATLNAALSEFDNLTGQIEREQKLEASRRQAEHEKEATDNELLGVFGKALSGETLSGNERSALAIRDPGLQHLSKHGAFRMPGDALEILNMQAGFTTPNIDSDDISELLVPRGQTQTISLPFPANPFWTRTTRVPALNGVAVPYIAQTIAEPLAEAAAAEVATEGAEKDLTDVKVGEEVITLAEQAAFAVVSDMALRKAPQFGGILQRFLVAALGSRMETLLIAAIAAATATDVHRAVANEVDWADLIELEMALPSEWAEGAEYALSGQALGYVKKQVPTNGPSPFYYPNAGQRVYQTLNGYPHFRQDALPDLGSKGDVLFANWSGLYIGVGQDIVLRQSSEGETLMRKNSTAFSCHAELGIGIPYPHLIVKLDVPDEG